MSDENTRNERSKRIKRDHRSIKKQLKIAKAYSIDVDNKDKHRLSKLKVLNCGDPNCFLCANPRKFNKGKNINSLTTKERAFLETINWIEDEEENDMIL